MFKSSQPYVSLELSSSQNHLLGIDNGPKSSKPPTYALLPTADSPHVLAIDRAEGTRKICLAALVLSTLVGIGAIVVGIISKGSNQTWRISTASKEFSILPINVVLLLVTEGLGYIHATSLRWALLDQGHLEFNANMRLLTFSKKFGPNNAFFSILFFICMALTYAAGNLLLVFNTSTFYETQLNNGGQTDYQQQWDYVQSVVSLTKVIPILLGLAILIMCAIDLWCLKRTRMYSWSSDPLTTVAISLQQGLVPRNGRAMMSVRDRNLPAHAASPIAKQPSPRSISKAVTTITVFIVLALLALIIWSAVITYVAYSNKAYRGQNGTSWSFIPTTTGAFAYINGLTGKNLQNSDSATITVFLFFFAANGDGYLTAVSEGRMVGVLLLYLAIQTIVTISMHFAELQIQLARDEHTWRKLQSRNGSQDSSIYNSVLQPMETWQGSGLLVFKVLIHWLFGAAIQVDYGQGMLMRPPQIVYLTVVWIGFVAFAATVAFSRPKGSLPATYGHLQTMADIADEWLPKMYWGDKGCSDRTSGVRHCGTRYQPLPPVLETERYA